MDKILTYTLQDEDMACTANGLVNLVLKNCIKITGKEVSRAKFLKNGITVDGKKVTVKDRMLPGQVIRVCLPERAFPEEKDFVKVPPVPAPPGILNILYEDEDLVVLNKPSGVVVHPTHGHFRDTLGNYLAEYYREQGIDVVCHVAGRLDMDTSGALVFAKNRVSASRLMKEREEKRFIRTYHAIVHGVPGKGEKTAEGWRFIDAPIEKRPDSLMLRQVAMDGRGDRAVTRYRILLSGVSKENQELSLVEFRIDTGRTHQIRVHMSSMGFPLFGDPLYGDGVDQGSRAMLHAARIEMLQPFTGEKILVDAPEPDDFERLKKEIRTESGR